MKYLLLLALVWPVSLWAQLKKITFPAADGLEVTADFYEAAESRQTPMIVLFHQAGSSRGEYRDIAPRLVRLGFNCLAVDQRSGNSRNGVSNETAARAAAEGKGTAFLDAIPDLEAAVAKAKADYSSGPLVIWGSSYSSTLVLKLMGEQLELADGVLSFSPGEYLGEGNVVRTAAAKVKAPTFVTAASNEENASRPIFEAIPAEDKVYFLPSSGGQHGSSTLNDGVANQALYWDAVTAFLARFQLGQKPAIEVTTKQMDGGQLSLSFEGTAEKRYRISASKDLTRWLALASVTSESDAMTLLDEAQVKRSKLFYRAEPVVELAQPEITQVSASGSAGSYRFNVTIRSPETGWERYADWWEVLDEKGDLLYRRVLQHPHVTEQPFTRSGGEVAITADQVVWVRAHMNDGGYGKAVFKGSVSAGFQAAELSPVFGSEAVVSDPLPNVR